MLRVVVVDDSRVSRDLLLEVLNGASDITVVGFGRDGLEAIGMVEQLKPDVITMDIQMPRLDGYAATEQIMSRCPTPIVVVSGSGNRPDVEKSMKALAAGALAVVAKPPAPTDEKFESAARHLVETVRSMASVHVVRRRFRGSPPEASGRTTVFRDEVADVRPDLVAIASSTGGPHALHQVFSTLPASFPVPIVVVQHISPGFVDGLVRWLDRAVPLPVCLAENGQRLQPGHIYVAPDGCHCSIGSGSTLKLLDQPRIGGFRPSANVLFESAARECGKAVLAVVLTGMGSDGVEGLRAVRQAGGTIVSQDKKSCVVYGMPRAAAEAGLSDAVLPLNAITDHLVRSTAGQAG